LNNRDETSKSSGDAGDIEVSNGVGKSTTHSELNDKDKTNGGGGGTVGQPTTPPAFNNEEEMIQNGDRGNSAVEANDSPPPVPPVEHPAPSAIQADPPGSAPKPIEFPQLGK
jgi:hypothetical protein